MAVDGRLEYIRNSILTSIRGRRLGFDPNGFLVGQPGVREAITGFAGSTVLSTATVALPNYGVSLVGSSGSSGSSVGSTSAYTLNDPVPGVRKLIMNPTTGNVAVISSTNATFLTTGSVTSTYWQITMNGKGACVDMIGLTTALWGVIDFTQISTGGTAVTFA